MAICFAPADFSTAELIVCVPMKQGWASEHLAFKHAFLSDKIARTSYIDIPKRVFLKKRRSTKIVTLWRTCRGWGMQIGCRSMSFTKPFNEIEITRMQNSNCFSSIQDSMLFATSWRRNSFRETYSIEQVIRKMGKRLKLKDLDRTKQFLGIE